MDTTINTIIADTQEKKFSEREVSSEQLMGCKTLSDAYKLCYAMAIGRDLKQIAGDCGMSEGALSRILGSGGVDDRRWMPHDKVIPFMVACGNSIPLQWLQLQWQILTKPNNQVGKTINEADLINRLDGIEAKVRLILSETKRPIGDDKFSISGAVDRPVWLMMDLVAVEMMLHGGAE